MLSSAFEPRHPDIGGVGGPQEKELREGYGCLSGGSHVTRRKPLPSASIRQMSYPRLSE
jgi:hypothetical protein